MHKVGRQSQLSTATLQFKSRESHNVLLVHFLFPSPIPNCRLHTNLINGWLFRVIVLHNSKPSYWRCVQLTADCFCWYFSRFQISTLLIPVLTCRCFWWKSPLWVKDNGPCQCCQRGTVLQLTVRHIASGVKIWSEAPNKDTVKGTRHSRVKRNLPWMRLRSLYLRKWLPSAGWAARPGSPPCRAPGAGTGEGEGCHPRPPKREAASGEAPAEFVRPTRSCWRLGLAAGSQCGRTSGRQSRKEADKNFFLSFYIGM